MAPQCQGCRLALPKIRRSANREALCVPCFVKSFEDEVYQVCRRYELFSPGDRVAVGVSGGKDSSALLHCLVTINDRFNMGLDIHMLAIDEGIQGYRDDSLECVQLAHARYKLPLTVIPYSELYNGWTMDKVVATRGKKSTCTYCGILRRQALEKGAVDMKATALATGHNADDSIETLLMNFLRGDIVRLQGCTGASTGQASSGEGGKIRRVKPFYFSFEKEVVLYCHFLKLDYFSTECTYSPNAYRGEVRTLVKKLEALNPRLIRQALYTYEQLSARNERPHFSSADAVPCTKCGMISTASVCKACQLIEGLETMTG